MSEIKKANCVTCLAADYGTCVKYGCETSDNESIMCDCCVNCYIREVKIREGNTYTNTYLIFNYVDTTWEEIASFLNVALDDIISMR